MSIKSVFLLISGLVTINLVQGQTATEPLFKSTTKGVLYHIFPAGDTAKIKISDVITFNVIEKTQKDSILFSSYQKGGPIKIQVQASQNIDDLMDIFPAMAAKDSAIVKIPTDSIFKNLTIPRPLFLSAGSYLIFNVKVERVQSLSDAMAERNAAIAQMKAAEAPAIAKYIADNKLVLKTTLSGLKYKINTPTLKRKPLKGDTMLVNYTGRTLDGKVFDSSIEAVAANAGLEQPGRTYQPYPVILGAAQVISGWEEGLLLLNEGSKATFIIPSSLAYGAEGNQGISPYAPLLFDIEVVKIIAGKHPVVKHTIKKKVAAKPAKKTTTAKKVQ